MIFISYAHIDIEKVRALVEVLEASGNEVWFDYELMPGQDWKNELYGAIQSCHAFLYALSETSVTSEWCQWEFANAIKLDKPIFPVVLQPQVHIPKPIDRFQYVDFSQGASPIAVAKLIGGLQLAQHVPTHEMPSIPDDPQGLPSRAWNESVKHCTDSVVSPKHTPQNEEETIIDKFAANLWRGMESVGGRIIVTNQRLLFESHGLNFSRKPLAIPIEEIVSMSKRNTLGIVPNGLSVVTIDGSEYRFVVYNREKIINLVQQHSSRKL